MFDNTSDDILIKNFYMLQTRVDVANLLEINDKSLRYFLYGVRPENMYHTFKIKKRNGLSREICAPNKELKSIQRKLAYILNLIYNAKPCAYGFVKNRSILDNAKNHVKKKEILNIDLKDFFTQIHFGRVRGVLKAKPYSVGDEAATTIAQIACYNGYLPQGAPSSPILTNMVCASLDNRLMSYAKKHGLVYTRYADDLSFSSNRKYMLSKIVHISDGKWSLCSELKHLIENQNFIINPDKISFKRKYERQEATGVVVNQFPNVKREYVRVLRAILHNCQKQGVYNTALQYIEKGGCKNKNIKDNIEKQDLVYLWFKKVIKGKINYIGQIKGNNDLTYLSFGKKANIVFGEVLFDVTALDYTESIIKKNTFILQSMSSETLRQGSAFYVPGHGLFTSYHVTDDGDMYNIFTTETYKTGRSLGTADKQMNEVKSDKDIDYALYNVKMKDTINVEIGDSDKLSIGDKVIIAGYPNMMNGDSVTIQNCQITGFTNLFGSRFYKVGGRIVHGYSGGIVLNSQNQVVGIVKGGVVDMTEEDKNDKQGFVPINLVMEHLDA